MHDAWPFIGIFAFMFLLWLATGGPSRPLSFSGPTLALPGALGGGTYLSLPKSPYQIKDGSGSRFSVGADRTTSSEVGGVAFGTPSVHRGTMRMSHHIVLGDLEDPDDTDSEERDPETEYVQISLSSNADGPVTISGWTLRSEATGETATIPGGADVLRAGVVNQALPIVLQPGERAFIVSGRSPLGISFQENKCIGYFSYFQSFSPSLPGSCPLPETELQTYYRGNYIQDPECIEYVDEVDRCEIINRAPSRLSNACRSFLTSYLTYNGCVDAHRADADFSERTWRIYLGRKDTLWRTEHEVVKLLDAEGKTVDAFTY